MKTITVAIQHVRNLVDSIVSVWKVPIPGEKNLPAQWTIPILSRCDAAVDGPGLIKYTAIVGTSLPGHGGAAGHAIFAFLPQDEVDETLRDVALERFTDNSLVTLAQRHTRYEKVRADGYAVSDGE